MVKFVAKQPVYGVSLNGLTLVSNPNKVTFTHREDDGFVADNGSARIKVSGEDFSYFGGRPTATSGTITGVRYFTYDSELDKYVLQYKLKDADLKLYDAATTSSLAEISREVFSGNDTIVGSKGDDYLAGFGKNDMLKGRDGNDTLHGDGGNDILNGGNGYDVLDGGKGKDTFLFKADPSTGYDTIASFQDGERLKFKAKIFDGLTKGPLEDHQFALGTVATEADHRFLYDSGTGFLRYDSDGVGGADAVIVAQMPANLVNFGAGNIFVI